MAAYPQNATVLGDRFQPGMHMTLDEQQRQQLSRQAAAMNRRAGLTGLTPNQLQTMRQQQLFMQQHYQQQQQQQQQQRLQQQQQAQAQQQQVQQGGPDQQTQQQNQHVQGQEGSIDARNAHSPPAPQSASPSKRQRLSPDGAYAQVAQVRGNPTLYGPATASATPHNPQQHMMMNTGMNPEAFTAAQMMQIKQQQQQSQQQLGHSHQTNQPGVQPQPAQQPNQLSQAALQAQQIQQYSNNLVNNHRALLNMSKLQNTGAPGIPGNSPMLMHTSSEQGHPTMYVTDSYNPNAATGQIRVPPGSQPSVGGNTNALQDYQMQLMLLEQQNKRRLMVARQEQQDAVIKQPGGLADPGNSAPGVPGGQHPGDGNAVFSNISPQQGRPAPSPQTNIEMVKRATPKIANQPIPGSPLPGDGQHQDQIHATPASRTASPNIATGFSAMDQFNMLVGNQMNNMMMRGMAPGQPGAAFNPAHLQQSAAAGEQGVNVRQQGGRMQPNGGNLIWPQPASQAGSASVPGQAGTPGQAGAGTAGMAQSVATQQGVMNQVHARQQVQQQQMPPPQGPPGTQRTSSPSMASTPIAAPTPPTKLLPKGKKEPREPKKRAKKQQSAGNQPATPSATPGATSEPPTPTTPITPQHPSSFSNGGQQNPPNHNSTGSNSLLQKAASFSALQNSSGNGSATSQSATTNSTATANGVLGSQGLNGPGSSQQDVPPSFLDADAPSFLTEFGAGADGDIGDLEFDINTFLNTDDSTAGGLNFDPTNAFGWSESVEATGDV
ncbi:hypothetical protein V1511DRAFT_523239 [Dipodascopsis uninucleata]